MNKKTQDQKITLQNDLERPKKENTEEDFSNPPPTEVGGRAEGLEPTRYGDWEFKGRCIDF